MLCIHKRLDLLVCLIRPHLSKSNFNNKDFCFYFQSHRWDHGFKYWCRFPKLDLCRTLCAKLALKWPNSIWTDNTVWHVFLRPHSLSSFGLKKWPWSPGGGNCFVSLTFVSKHKQKLFFEAGFRLMLLTSLYFAQFLMIKRISDTNSWVDL